MGVGVGYDDSTTNKPNDNEKKTTTATQNP